LARERPAAALLLAVVLLGALANAGAVGFGGAVHARYQSRIAWLFPLAAGVALAVLRSRTPASGQGSPRGTESRARRLPPDRRPPARSVGIGRTAPNVRAPV
jgi:hypothetical protein